MPSTTHTIDAWQVWLGRHGQTCACMFSAEYIKMADRRMAVQRRECWISVDDIYKLYPTEKFVSVIAGDT